MGQRPLITENEIQQRATPQSFARGASYFAGGYVENMIQRADMLTADVAGSQYEPYHVEIQFHGNSIDNTFCNCPYDWSGDCKHIVAVLLAYLHDETAVSTRPSLDRLLADLDEAQLRQVLLTVVETQPSAIDAIETAVAQMQAGIIGGETAVSHTPTINPDAIRQTIRGNMTQFAPSRYYDNWYDYDESPNYVEALDPFVQQAQAYLNTHDANSALAVLDIALSEWFPQINKLADYHEELFYDATVEQLSDVDKTLAEAILSKANWAAGDKKTWQNKIKKWLNIAGDDAALVIALTALEQGWDYPPLVQVIEHGNISSQGAWAKEAPWFANDLANVRLNVLARQERWQAFLWLAEAEGQLGRHVNMLAQQGQIEQAVNEAMQYLTSPTELLSLAQLLYKGGHKTAAFTVAAHGLKQASSYNLLQLARWLRETAVKEKEQPLANQAAYIAFQASHTLADYIAAEQTAGPTWPAQKPRLLAALATVNYATDAPSIYLHENMLPAAMAAISQNYHDTLQLEKVITAVQTAYPDWAIQQCQQQAKAIINAGKAKDYDVATWWLAKAKPIFIATDRQADWLSYLDSLLEQHRRKYKLTPMLKKIR